MNIKVNVDLEQMLRDQNEAIQRKIKGYGYDSLCLRYNAARDAQAELEIIRAHKTGTALKDNQIYSMAKRDKMRFYEILNDLIGEHD